jgi:hypothetical protein
VAVTPEGLAGSLSSPRLHTIRLAWRYLLGARGTALCLSKANVFEAEAVLNRVEPLAWLTDVLERMVSGRTKAHELERLLPWTWKAERWIPERGATG